MNSLAPEYPRRLEKLLAQSGIPHPSLAVLHRCGLRDVSLRMPRVTAIQGTHTDPGWTRATGSAHPSESVFLPLNGDGPPERPLGATALLPLAETFTCHGPGAAGKATWAI